MAPRATSKVIVEIKPPNLQEIHLKILGTAPLVMLRFSEKAQRQMKDKHEAGSTAKVNKSKPKRDFDADFRAALYVAEEGWYGVPASALRNAMINACRLVGFEMTRAKMAIFVLADGTDAQDGTPLVRLISGEPEMRTDHVRNATGVADIRVRGMWREWSAVVRIRFDADILSSDHVVNLLNRAGMQVGILEGRPFSKASTEMGWGTFIVMEGDTE